MEILIQKNGKLTMKIGFHFCFHELGRNTEETPCPQLAHRDKYDTLFKGCYPPKM